MVGFDFLFKRQKDIHSRRARVCWLIPQMLPVRGKPGAGRSVRVSHSVAGPQLLEPALLCPRVCMSRKLAYVFSDLIV